MFGNFSLDFIVLLLKPEVIICSVLTFDLTFLVGRKFDAFFLPMSFCLESMLYFSRYYSSSSWAICDGRREPLLIS
jgi:hypothetical protein